MTSEILTLRHFLNETDKKYSKTHWSKLSNKKSQDEHINPNNLLKSMCSSLFQTMRKAEEHVDRNRLLYQRAMTKHKECGYSSAKKENSAITSPYYSVKGPD